MSDIIKIKRTTNMSNSPDVEFGELAVKSSAGNVIVFIGDETSNPIEVAGTNFAKLNSTPLEQNIKNVLLKYININ